MVISLVIILNTRNAWKLKMVLFLKRKDTCNMFIKKIYELRIRAEPEKAFFIAKISEERNLQLWKRLLRQQ